MGKIQISTGKENVTSNTTTVWDRIVALESNLDDIPENIGNTMESLETQLAEKPNKTDLETEVITKRVHFNPIASDNVIPLEIHNQSGQATGGTTGLVVHNYTDGGSVIVDNVGTGTILTVSNSRNITMRPDKATNFVGTGKLLQYRKFNVTLGDYEYVLTIDENGNITKTGLGSGTDGTFTIAQNKADNGFWAMIYNVVNKHVAPYKFQNGGSFLAFLCENTKTKASFVSDAVMTGGMEVRAESGDLNLKATNGKVTMLSGGSVVPVQGISVVTPIYRLINPLVGMQAFDTTLGKPIWCKTVNGGYGSNAARGNSTAYSLNMLILQNGLIFQVTTAGTTASTPPTFPTTVGATVTDGTVVWTCRGVPSVWVDATGAIV